MGVVLIFEILMKQLTLILLAFKLRLILTQAQIFIFALVVMIYIPA
jgi:hypothetical protein